MPLYRIVNLSNGRLQIPAPVSRLVSVQFDEVVEATASSIDSPEFQVLIRKRLISCTAITNADALPPAEKLPSALLTSSRERLMVGAIGDGEALIRSGGSICSVPVPAIGAENPMPINAALSSSGTLLRAARVDHRHQVETALTTGEIAIGAAAAEGVSVALARADHSHPFPAPTAVPADVRVGGTYAGVSNAPSRSDHGHSVLVAAPVGLGRELREGSSPALARADHVHPLTALDVIYALAGASTSVPLNGQRISGLGSPANASDATTREYVDGLWAITSGGDLSGSRSAPAVIALTAAGVRLSLSSIADGEMLVRAGTQLVGRAVSQGDVVGPASAIENSIPVFSAVTGKRIASTNLVFQDGELRGLSSLTVAGGDFNARRMKSFVFEQDAVAAPRGPAFLFACGANTEIAVGAELHAMAVSLGAFSWRSGSVDVQRFIRVSAPTVEFVDSGSVSDAVTLAVEAPVAGRNASITRAWAAAFNGNVKVAGQAWATKIVGGAEDVARLEITDFYVGVTSSKHVTIHLPTGCADGQVLVVKDERDVLSMLGISVVPAAGDVLESGNPSTEMNQGGAVLRLIKRGSRWVKI